MVIFWNSGSTFQKVSAISCNYDYYGSIFITVFIHLTHYWVAMLGYIPRTKIRNNTKDTPFGRTEPKKHLRLNKIVEREISSLIEIKSYSFSYVLSSTVTNLSWFNNWSLSYAVDRKPIKDLSSEILCFLLYILICSLNL